MKFTVFMVSSFTIMHSLNEHLSLLCVFKGEEWEERLNKSPVVICLFLDEYLTVYFFICAFWLSSTGCLGYTLSLSFVISKLLVFMTSIQGCSPVQRTEMQSKTKYTNANILSLGQMKPQSKTTVLSSFLRQRNANYQEQLGKIFN